MRGHFAKFSQAGMAPQKAVSAEIGFDTLCPDLLVTASPPGTQQSRRPRFLQRWFHLVVRTRRSRGVLVFYAACGIPEADPPPLKSHIHSLDISFPDLSHYLHCSIRYDGEEWYLTAIEA